MPAEEFLRVLTENPGEIPATFLFYRGDPQQPKQEIAPGDLTVCVAEGQNGQIAKRDPHLPTTGRRLAYARRIMSGRHPLVGRVLVNRVWLLHFGRGIVGTPADFGHLGDRPTHPELLDWLADEFASTGWDLKRLHRLIVTSTAYRQDSARTPDRDAADPDNLLLSRMNVRRLDAEIIRDSVLAASGSGFARMYGPPIPVKQDAVGQIVVGVDTRVGANEPGADVPLGSRGVPPQPLHRSPPQPAPGPAAGLRCPRHGDQLRPSRRLDRRHAGPDDDEQRFHADSRPAASPSASIATPAPIAGGK